jgi:hypothetical protein
VNPQQRGVFSHLGITKLEYEISAENGKGRYKGRTMIDRLFEHQISGFPEILWGRFTADSNVVEAYRAVVVADDEAGFYAALRGPRQAQ